MPAERPEHALHRGTDGGVEPTEVVSLFDAAAVCLVLHHDDGSIAVATRCAAELFDMEPQDLEGLKFGEDGPALESVDGALLRAEDLPWVQALHRGETSSATVRSLGLDGRERWLHLESKPLKELAGPYSVATTIDDATAQRERERRLSHDEVTGLGTRVLALEYLRSALARADRRRGAVAVLFVDLDNFKAVNDAFGHAAGDRLLRMFAERLRTAMRASDFIGRLGGDEFVIVAADFDPVPAHGRTASEVATEAARAIAERIQSALAAPIDDGELTTELAASVGVAIYPDYGSDVDALLLSADQAMYDAKAAGRGCVRFFVPPNVAASPRPRQATR